MVANVVAVLGMVPEGLKEKLVEFEIQEQSKLFRL